MNPEVVSRFAYRLGRFLFADVYQRFGWRGSPGWRLEAGAIQEAFRRPSGGLQEVDDENEGRIAAVSTAGVPEVKRIVCSIVV